VRQERSQLQVSFDDTTQQLAVSREDNELLTADLKERQEQIVQSQRACGQLELDLKIQQEDYQRQMAVLEQDIQSLQGQLASTNTELETAHQTITEGLMIRHTLQEQIEHEQAQLDQLTQQKTELESHIE
ncbi:MAG: hypothetical protein ACYSOH_06670, partial [Planctomycetota bacterium]|jgi:chromosome segregation ATPase